MRPEGELPEACSRCDVEGIPDEMERVEGEWICLECYCEEYHFTCCRCQAHGEARDQHNMVVVFEAGGESVPPGVYRVVARPYYCEGMLEGSLYPHALERIGELTADLDSDDYACGHLCLECQGWANERHGDEMRAALVALLRYRMDAPRSARPGDGA